MSFIFFLLFNSGGFISLKIVGGRSLARRGRRAVLRSARRIALPSMATGIPPAIIGPSQQQQG
jgi:hypothetical protein